jgi:hypothetical protein
MTSNIYRVYPVLWEGPGCAGAQTVYAVDRQPPSGTFPVQCASRPTEDPASVWDNRTFWRILPPPDSVSGCCQPASFAAVTWATLTGWLSWIQTKGYSLAPNTDMSRIRPHGEVYIVGP